MDYKEIRKLLGNSKIINVLGRKSDELLGGPGAGKGT